MDDASANLSSRRDLPRLHFGPVHAKQRSLWHCGPDGRPQRRQLHLWQVLKASMTLLRLLWLLPRASLQRRRRPHLRQICWTMKPMRRVTAAAARTR
jgi:hypothetical protein